MRLKPSVLVVDDDPLFRKALESVLSRFGLNIKTTENGSEFKECVANLAPNLLMIDLQIGDESGFDLISFARGALPDSIIIVVSGSTEKSDITHALELGANDFILKPLNRSLLASKLSLYLDTDSLHEQSAEFLKLKEIVPGSLELKAVIEEVDELGFKILSNHLIPKGTVLKIRSDFFQSMGAPSKDYLASVTSTSYHSNSELYSLNVEFEESPDQDMNQTLRRWLIQNKKN